MPSQRLVVIPNPRKGCVTDPWVRRGGCLPDLGTCRERYVVAPRLYSCLSPLMMGLLKGTHIIDDRLDEVSSVIIKPFFVMGYDFPHRATGTLFSILEGLATTKSESRRGARVCIRRVRSRPASRLSRASPSWEIQWATMEHGGPWRPFRSGNTLEWPNGSRE